MTAEVIYDATFNNLQFTTKAFGLAFKRKRWNKDTGMVHYASFAGSNTACESMRATLHKKNARLPHCSWMHALPAVAPGMATSKVRLPNSTELHYIMWNKAPEVIIVRDDRMLDIKMREDVSNKWKKIEDLQAELRPTLLSLFAQAINTISKAPMLTEWADKVMDQTKYDDAWEELEIYGDVVHAVVLDKSYDWARKLCQLLEAKIITIPTLPPALANLAAANAPATLTLSTTVADDAANLAQEQLKPLFEPGRIVSTRNFKNIVGDAFPFNHYLSRHLWGEWREDEMDAEDIAANRNAIKSGDKADRIFSVFHYPDDNTSSEPLKFWVITEWDRSATTFLLPEDY